jgi:hypothetical protein
VDLQLAYLAAPQNAAQSSVAQNAPQAAQQAAQAVFAAQVREREERVAKAEPAESTLLRTNPGGGNGQPQYHRRERRAFRQQSDEGAPLGLAGEGEHFIDVTV